MARFRRRFYRRPRRYAEDPYAVAPPTRDPYLVEERVETVVDDVPPRPRWPLDSPWFWLALFGILTLVAVLTIILVQTVDDDPAPTVTISAETANTIDAPLAEVVPVPNVVGTNYVEAGRTIDSLGLVADTFPVASGQPLGTVVAQAPAPDTDVPPAQIVHLDVALGPATPPAAVVPDVTGPPALDARVIARQAGFTSRTIYRDAPSADEQGEVIDQDPPARTNAPQLTQITLYVGR